MKLLIRRQRLKSGNAIITQERPSGDPRYGWYSYTIKQKKARENRSNRKRKAA